MFQHFRAFLTLISVATRIDTLGQQLGFNMVKPEESAVKRHAGDYIYRGFSVIKGDGEWCIFEHRKHILSFDEKQECMLYIDKLLKPKMVIIRYGGKCSVCREETKVVKFESHSDFRICDTCIQKSAKLFQDER